MHDLEFSVPGPFETLRLGLAPLGAPRLTHEQLVRARWAAHEIRMGLEWGDPATVTAAEEIYDALHGRSGLLVEPRWERTPAHGARLERLADELQLELESGRLVVLEGGYPLLGIPPEQQIARRVRPPDIDPPRPKRPAKTDELTFFEARFIDEIGEPIGGLAVEITAGAEARPITTNPAGVALLDNVTSMSASVRVVDVAALDRLLKARWAKPRIGHPPTGARAREIAFDGTDFGPTSLKPAVPNVIVLRPPLFLGLKLLDQDGKPVTGRAFKVVLPDGEERTGVTDHDGAARIEGFARGGTAKISFPAFDQRDFERAAIAAGR